MSGQNAGWDGLSGSSGPQDSPDPAPVTPTGLGAQGPTGPTPPQTRPRGPNWGLVLLGLLLLLVAAGVVVQQLTGLDPAPSMEQRGPLIFVAVGIGCALVGVVGMLRRDS